MYSIKGKQATRIEPVTFSEMNMTENDIEEILRNSIDIGWVILNYTIDIRSDTIILNININLKKKLILASFLCYYITLIIYLLIYL